MKLDVLGLRRARIDLGRAIPEGAEAVGVNLVKPAWRRGKVRVGLTVAVPGAAPVHDEDAVRAALHAVAAALPADATPLRAVEAARAAGLAVRGEDLGVSHPSCDDAGRATAPVRIPRADLRRMASEQRALSRREAHRHAAEKAGAPKGRPSGKARRNADAVTAILRRAADRPRTRACQDAAALTRGVVLVPTDPLAMVGGLYRKGGPAERRARAAAGGPMPDSQARSRGWAITPADERALRRNLHSTSFAFRVRRTATLCGGLGAVHVTPGHAGTTRTCPACLAVAPKPLSQRRHECPCGLSMPRDQASALVTLGRGILAFREEPDPGGLLAARHEAEAGARRKRRERDERMKAGAAAAAEQRHAEVPLRHWDMVIPGHETPAPRRRVRGQGRNVGRVPQGISN